MPCYGTAMTRAYAPESGGEAENPTARSFTRRTVDNWGISVNTRLRWPEVEKRTGWSRGAVQKPLSPWSTPRGEGLSPPGLPRMVRD